MGSRGRGTLNDLVGETGSELFAIEAIGLRLRVVAGVADGIERGKDLVAALAEGAIGVVITPAGAAVALVDAGAAADVLDDFEFVTVHRTACGVPGGGSEQIEILKHRTIFFAIP